MEKNFTIFENRKGNVKLFINYLKEDDQFMSIDYYQETGTNTFIGGDFIFDDNEKLYKSFGVTDFEGLCNVLKNEIVSTKNQNPKYIWNVLKTKFENKNIDIIIDENEGFDGDSSFFVSNF